MCGLDKMLWIAEVGEDVRSVLLLSPMMVRCLAGDDSQDRGHRSEPEVLKDAVSITRNPVLGQQLRKCLADGKSAKLRCEHAEYAF